MKQQLICAICFFAFFAGSQFTSRAQLFDDLEKRENASTSGWVMGVDVGAIFAFYSIDVEHLPSDQAYQNSSSYLSPGFHIGGVVLRSFDGFKVGGNVSFQRFTGKDEPIVFQNPGIPANEANLDAFREVSVRMLNLSARGEIPVMSSVEGGLFIVGDIGISILSGDFPGTSVSPPLRGAFGIAYEFRLSDQMNFQLELMNSFTRFRNELNERELTHLIISSYLSAGIRF